MKMKKLKKMLFLLYNLLFIYLYRHHLQMKKVLQKMRKRNLLTHLMMMKKKKIIMKKV